MPQHSGTLRDVANKWHEAITFATADRGSGRMENPQVDIVLTICAAQSSGLELLKLCTTQPHAPAGHRIDSIRTIDFGVAATRMGAVGLCNETVSHEEL